MVGRLPSPEHAIRVLVPRRLLSAKAKQGKNTKRARAMASGQGRNAFGSLYDSWQEPKLAEWKGEGSGTIQTLPCDARLGLHP